MADSYHIIDGQVVPYCGGRRCNDTDAWRDATPLELQLQEQLAESENAIAAQAAEIEALRAEVERVTCELMDATTRADKLEAAAPELLAALVELRDWYTEHTGLPAVAANAAIAKATGEAA